MVEQSYLGQLYRILRMHIDVPATVASFCRSGAAPFAAAEIVAKLEQDAIELQTRQAETRLPVE